MKSHLNVPPGRARLPALAMAGVLVLGAAACAGHRPEGTGGPGKVVTKRSAGPGESVSKQRIGRLKVGVLGAIPTLDPNRNLGAGLYTNSLGLESLLRVGHDGRLEPWLATGYEQKSTTVYEYHLRRGVKFSDGSPLTSEDVRYSWNYYRARGSARAHYYANVADISTPDEHTVRVTLKTPDASWKYTPAMFWSGVFQKKHAEAHKATFGQPGTLVVATGPWKFDSLNPTSGMELTVNEHYWGGRPAVGRISVTSYSEDNSLALALRSGEIDLAPGVGSPKAFDATAGKNTVTTVATCATALLSLPTRTAPWDDAHVRRAVAYALDREAVVASTQGRAGAPLQTLISPLLMRPLGSEERVDKALATVPTYEHDIAKAKAELAKSKVPHGFSGTFVTAQSFTPTVEVIVDQLKKVGINLRIQSMNDTAWASKATGPAHQRPVTAAETGACSPDPSFDSIFLGKANTAQGGLNLANYTPPRIDELIASGLTAQRPAQRLRIYTDLLKHLGRDVPYVPLYAEGAHYASLKYGIAGFDSYTMNMPWALNVVAE
ncbi:ABC transporter substrate-binding protein [Streptomyces flavofungini]|uniref:ABC transporter substrate-binding protein n=1 Tax=Streptomyces flavofungini TaxID=68200 RepID=UPI0034DF256D